MYLLLLNNKNRKIYKDSFSSYFDIKMAEKQSLNLESRLIGEVNRQVSVILDTVQTLLSNATYPDLLGDNYGALRRDLELIETGAKDTSGIVQELGRLYGAQEQKAETFETNQADKSLERTLIHDALNNLMAPVAFSDLILIDEQYAELLGSEYEDFRNKVIAIQTAANETGKLFTQLGGFYRAQEQGVKLVDESTLGPEEIKYRIFHVDDEEDTRYRLMEAILEGSNLSNPRYGTFGHDGKGVRYELYSYGSVEEALRAIPELKEIDLLITDREMPERNGYSLLDALNEQSDKHSRRPEFNDVRHIAMLTGGITQEEAEQAQRTYGITILTKPFKPLQLEQQIYRIINPPTQS